VFLHGYTEPLLLLLHEPEPTWPGRYRERHDTCQLSGLSLNFKRSRYPLIWSVPNLPSDCCRLMAVPRGGVLVLSQSLIMYHTQVGCISARARRLCVYGLCATYMCIPTVQVLPAFAALHVSQPKSLCAELGNPPPPPPGSTPQCCNETWALPASALSNHNLRLPQCLTEAFLPPLCCFDRRRAAAVCWPSTATLLRVRCRPAWSCRSPLPASNGVLCNRTRWWQHE
jgi:hypothetical protein